MTTCLRSCDMNAIGDAANPWSVDRRSAIIHVFYQDSARSRVTKGRTVHAKWTAICFVQSSPDECKYYNIITLRYIVWVNIWFPLSTVVNNCVTWNKHCFTLNAYVLLGLTWGLSYKTIFAANKLFILNLLITQIKKPYLDKLCGIVYYLNELYQNGLTEETVSSTENVKLNTHKFTRTHLI